MLASQPALTITDKSYRARGFSSKKKEEKEEKEEVVVKKR